MKAAKSETAVRSDAVIEAETAVRAGTVVEVEAVVKAEAAVKAAYAETVGSAANMVTAVAPLGTGPEATPAKAGRTRTDRPGARAGTGSSDRPAPRLTAARRFSTGSTTGPAGAEPATTAI
ncbi:hypothetical protein ACFV06_22055 [Streptomyces sp. NPDC059618]|uniref:hypothetical protein n=1 Tax=Streptomyces sp. NPDC059618 TaxID=3346887 RepID=UPI003674BBEC